MRNPYAASMFAVVGAVLVVIQSALDPLGVGREGVTLDEKIAIAVALLAAVEVYVVPNLTATVGAYAKTIIHGGLAVLAVVASYMVGGLSSSDWVNLVVLFGTTTGVFFANSPKHPTTTAPARAA